MPDTLNVFILSHCELLESRIWVSSYSMQHQACCHYHKYYAQPPSKELPFLEPKLPEDPRFLHPKILSLYELLPLTCCPAGCLTVGGGGRETKSTALTLSSASELCSIPSAPLSKGPASKEGSPFHSSLSGLLSLICSSIPISLMPQQDIRMWLESAQGFTEARGFLKHV
ncbi:hypothetical protein KIL84_020489 [Mauremys mutica]|uniref:Uncharacterized protein n=1 Tax=Mauremys mutica TaxID=74926 RepID=A0A9D4BBK6_9SAUR|nr:hypothetical protein KIL84_020489 [Mauremys mutica]